MPFKGGASVLWAVLVIFLGYVSFAMFRLGLGVVLPSIIREMGIGEFEAGVLYSIPLWSTAAFLILSGWMADYFGRKKILLLGYLLLAIGTLLFSHSHSYLLSAASLALSGFAASMIITSYYSLLGIFLRQVRGFAVGLGHASYSIGGLIGSYFIGVFAALEMWRTAIAVIGILQFLMLLIQTTTLKVPYEVGERRSSLSLFDMLKTRNVLFSSIGIFMGSVGYFAANSWLASFLILRGLSYAEAGLTFGLYLIAGALSSPFFGGLSERVGRRTMNFYLSIATIAISAVTFLPSEPALLSAVCAVLLGAFISPYWSLLVTIVQESVPEANVSAAVGIAHTFGALGSAMGPVLSGALIPRLEINNALLISVTLSSILCGLITLLFVKDSRQL